MLNSNKARDLGLDNTPGYPALNNLTWTALGLERIRKLIGDLPIIILSGFRSESVNTAVGGSTNSQHCRGQAADFVSPRYGTAHELALLIANNAVLLSVDQVIYESGWVHCSFSMQPRYEALTKIDGKYKKGVV